MTRNTQGSVKCMHLQYSPQYHTFMLFCIFTIFKHIYYGDFLLFCPHLNPRADILRGKKQFYCDEGKNTEEM